MAHHLSFDGLVCDLDGVVYRGETPVEGAVAAITRLRGAGVRIVFCTNNSAFTVEQYRARLSRMGVETRPEEILTSAVVTGEALAARGLGARRAMVIGEAGLRASVAAARLVIDDEPANTDLDVVVVGLDRSFDYAALRRALLALRAGAAFIASNDDPTYPVSHELEWPGAGAILASVEAASGRRAEVMGKPHRPMMDAAEKRLAGARRIAIVGDRPQTDLRGGVAKGWFTVLVLSGVTGPKDAVSAEPRPDLVIESLALLAP